MAGQKITDLVEEYLRDFLDREGLELYNVTYGKEGKDRFLKVYIDTGNDETYISSDDCEKVSRYLEEILDRENPISQNYYLVVSSPGMDRELITDRHFARYTGRQVDVRLYRGMDGTKKMTGELLSKTDDTLSIRLEDGEIKAIPMDNVSKVRLAVII